MSIYTKTGDKGKTSTFNGKRVSKSSKLINAIGSIDELNSFLGIIGGFSSIQEILFTINAILAGSGIKFPSDAVKNLESEIDKIEAFLPVQKNFLIYSGTKKARDLFFARALCRRAERELVALKMPDSKHQILTYINRLSDYLFIKAREDNFKNRAKEVFWKISNK